MSNKTLQYDDLKQLGMSDLALDIWGNMNVLIIEAGDGYDMHHDCGDTNYFANIVELEKYLEMFA